MEYSTEFSSCFECAYGKREDMRILCRHPKSEYYGQRRKFAQTCSRFAEERPLGIILGDENGETIIDL